MPRMIDLMRQSAVSANVMRSAAKGALTLPPAEMIEILVYLTTNPIFAVEAKMTLAGWDEPSSLATAANPDASWEVLNYMIALKNLRPKMVPALLENPSIREAALIELAQRISREMVEFMFSSPRVRRSPHILHALLTNPELQNAEADQVREFLKSTGEETVQIAAYKEVEQEDKTQYEIEHAAEIAAEETANKPFVLYGQNGENVNIDELMTLDPVEETIPLAAAQSVAANSSGAAAAVATAIESFPVVTPANEPLDEKTLKMRAAEAKSKERVSALQKIARMGVKERIQLAMKGSKEERFILVRDGSKLVSQAVLQSPKISDQEVEMFAGMKNVQEGVLRDIARNHKFMKNYGVARTLVNNPRCPLDLSLSLLNHILLSDLKALSMNKNVPETLKKLAQKKFKDKTETKRG